MFWDYALFLGIHMTIPDLERLEPEPLSSEATANFIL